MRHRVHAVLLACCLVAVPSAASAEWFADLYLGRAFTQKSDITVSALGVTDTTRADWDDSFTAGGRVGYWLGRPGWLGLGFDASFFRPDSDTTVIPVSALLMLRVPLLTSAEFPQGRLQPYIAAGPGVFISRVSGDASELGIGNVSDTSVDVGADVRGGVAYQITKNLAVFAEYRFTHVKPEFTFDILGLRTRAETTFDTHHALGGISFRF